MNIPFYQIDAFANEIFKGNPAGVCPLKEWLPESTMQKIAFENNLSETAFYVKEGEHFHIRWFTPTFEIDLCGHATLASAFVEFNINNNPLKELSFNSKGGNLKVIKQKDGLLTLNFPIIDYQEVPLTEELLSPFNPKPIKALKTDNYDILVFKNANDIENLEFDLSKIAKLKSNGTCVTAPGNEFDFVSRFFAPQSGINEDPVTGSAHTFLTPLWSKEFDKTLLKAKQVSPRGGELICEVANDRVLISGTAKLYLKGEIVL